MDGITESLAFDRASVRTIDANGRLQISRTNISKANVNAYYGREIPGSEELGLDPNKLYRLWRHPDELRKAAKTFNNIPVLSKHIPDFPTDPPNEFRVGVTHSNAEFDGTYLTVGMSIWDNSAIAGIESGEQRELSASYKYVADMTPGVTPDGELMTALCVTFSETTKRWSLTAAQGQMYWSQIHYHRSLITCVNIR